MLLVISTSYSPFGAERRRCPAHGEVTVYKWMHARVGRIQINMHDSTAVGSRALYANDLIQV